MRQGCDYAAQQELVSNLVARGVDGIAISPIDADHQTKFLNGIAARTLPVCADSDAEKSQRNCYVGPDNVAAAAQAAALLKVALLVGFTNAQNTMDQIRGIQQGLAGSNIRILDTLADGTQSSIAQKNAEDALARHPDLAGLVGLNGYRGPAVLTAVRSAGKVQIVCFDDYNETLAGVAAGDSYGTVVQKPLEFGNQTIIRMARFLRGDQTQLAGGKILLPSRALTNDDIAGYQSQKKALLLRLEEQHS